ncbi:MAG: FAD-dependent oxidoreductase [bacterium]
MSQTVAIIGAGPIGLEAALYATQLGYQVVVFEKGQVGDNLRKWGHVSLFSPWEMNHSSLGVRSLKQHFPQWQEPEADTIQTGYEFVETYLKPLSQLPFLVDRIRAGVKVISIGRNQIFKGELIGDANRATYPFRILTADAEGRERVYPADVVLDASGVYGHPNWLGEGGIPAPGEHKSKPFLDYHLRDVTGKDRARFAGKKTLLVGAGYSAATTVCDFQNLIREEPSTALLWVIRDNRSVPIPVIEDDPLATRASLTAKANGVAHANTPGIEFRNNTTIDSVEYLEQIDQLRVGLNRKGTIERVQVDRVIANVGYGPDNSIYRELQVHECWASRAPMKLAAALLGAGSASADCLAQESMGAETLRNPEPNFYIIGNKSYGRNPTFLLRIGLSQITEVFSLITGDSKLNLYHHVGQEITD